MDHRTLTSIKKLTLIATIAGLLSVAGVALAQGLTDGNIAYNDQDYVGRIIVITDPLPVSGTHCGVTFNDYRCVIIKPGGGPATLTECGIDQNILVDPGDRFDIIAQQECDGRLGLALTPR